MRIFFFSDLLLFKIGSNYLQEWLICSGITQKAERFGFCVFGFGRSLMNHFGLRMMIMIFCVWQFSFAKIFFWSSNNATKMFATNSRLYFINVQHLLYQSIFLLQDFILTTLIIVAFQRMSHILWFFVSSNNWKILQ